MKARHVSDIHGFVLLDKPENVTSRRCVDAVQRVFSKVKAGHAGTLDPFASGLLPICVGRATKLIEYLQNSHKTYVAVLRLGTSTDTQDITGQVIKETPVNPSITMNHIQAVCDTFCGDISQIPPMFSSVKHNGKRLYTLARQQIEVARKPRKVHIYSLTVLEYNRPEVSFSVKCSKGTYIRTLSVDIAGKLGLAGMLTELRRMQIGHWHVDDAVSLKSLKKTDVEKQDFLLPASLITSHLPTVRISAEGEQRFRNGSFLSDEHYIDDGVFDDRNPILNVFGESGRFLGLARYCGRDKNSKSVLKIMRLIDI